MTLTPKEKVLVGVGISVAAGCKPCTDSVVESAREAGADDDEIRRAVNDAIGVRRSATEIMAAHGLRHVGETHGTACCDDAEETTRMKELVSMGAALAVNCTSNLEKHLKSGGTVGITEDEVKVVAGLAAFIKNKAASHVKHLVGNDEGNQDAGRQGNAATVECPFSGAQESTVRSA